MPAPLTTTRNGANLISHSGQIQLKSQDANNLSFSLSYTRAKSIDDAVKVALNPPEPGSGTRAFHQRPARRALLHVHRPKPVDQRGGLLSNKGFLTRRSRIGPSRRPLPGRPAALTPDHSGRHRRYRNHHHPSGRKPPARVYQRQRILHTGAFIVPHLGNVRQRGTRHHSRSNQFLVNFNMARTITLKERKSLEIQINSTNILNHANPSSFSTTIGSVNTGVLTGMGQMRVITGTIRFRM